METILRLKVSTKKKLFSIHWDNESKVLIVEATEAPEKGKANKEILKKLKKFFEAEIEIVSGLTSREKIVSVYLPEREVLEKLNHQDKLIL